MDNALALIIISNCSNIIFNNDSSSSSDEDEVVMLELNEVIREAPQEKPARILHFIENTISNFTAKEFQSHFRINRAAFDVLLQMLTPSIEKANGKCGKNRIDAGQQILSTLWILATPDSYRSIGCRFNMGKSSLFVCFSRVVEALYKTAPKIIKWPNEEERIDIKRKFTNIAGLTNVIGCIDGTYVPIKAPRENPEGYINRKCFHGYTLQAVCVRTLKFIDCFTGYPSSVSDNRVFRNSTLYESVQEDPNIFFSEGDYILGDKAYPLYSWCIPPYIDRGQLAPMHTNFNTIHAKTREVIERSFALLFGRFRRLRYLDMNRNDLIPKTIIACCVLHNICLMDIDDFVNEFISEGEEFIENDEVDAVNQPVGGNRNIGNDI